MPLQSPYPVLAGAHPLAIAHRGGAGEAPENSELAFRHAADLGFTFLETDVRATADGVAVVFHDASLDRSTDSSGLIRRMDLAELRLARIHGRSEILTLEELLERFPGMRFNLDVKEPNAIEPFLSVMRAAEAWHRVVVASFSHERLRRLRRMGGPRLATSLSPKEVAALWLRSRREAAPANDPSAACVQVPPGLGSTRIVTPAFVRAAHARGWQVHAWTIDDPVLMHELLDLGVDGIMTDRPTLLREVLEGRSQWS